MYVYDSTHGHFSRDGVLICYGYSGFGLGKQNAAYEVVKDVGPIPRGRWMIGAPFNSDTHGPVVLPLTPKFDAHGRDGFLIHGDSIAEPGQASKGCLILDRQTRELIATGEDHELMVV